MARMVQSRSRRPLETREASAHAPWDFARSATPVPAAAEEAADDRLGWLVHAIEAEIIPRLMLAHQTAVSVSGTPRAFRFGIDDVGALTSLVVARDAQSSAAHVRALHSAGASLETIYLDLLAPTARRLGTLWENDECSFTEVTIGLWRLQQLMHDLSPAFHSQASPPSTTRAHADGAPRRALLAPMPGSVHTFGVSMVAEFFRRAGWQVLAEPAVATDELLETACAEWFDVIGLSVGTTAHLACAASVILALRKKSLNPAVAVLVGGPAVVDSPDAALRLGADAIAIDAPQAIQQAEMLLVTRDRCC